MSFWLFLKMGMTTTLANLMSQGPALTMTASLSVPCSPTRRAIVDKVSPLLQRCLADRDHICAEALGPPARTRRERQPQQHQ
jgi:hypothetical protein